MKFLKEIQKLLSDPSIRCRSDLFNIYRLPFRFVIPHMLISARSDMDPEFLKLCPSAKVGLTFRGPETAHIYRQPMITYTLRVKQIRTGMRVGTSMKCYKEREIIIMPYTPPAPPLRIEHFPRDYKSCSTKIIKQHRWSRPLGTLEISAAEPSPLNVLTMAPKSSTFVVMMIIFKPRLDICPWNWKFAVKYHLRSRTFCSTRKLDRVPTRSTVRLDQSLTMHDVNSAPEVREYGTLRWRRENHLILERSDLSKNDNLCLWTTTLILPVNASKSLLPTFLNPLSARQYALVLRLSIEGLYHEALELVLPLQVIYYPAEGVLVGLEEEGSTNEEGVFSGVQISDQFTPLSTGPGPSLLRVRNISPPPYDFC